MQLATHLIYLNISYKPPPLTSLSLTCVTYPQRPISPHGLSASPPFPPDYALLAEHARATVRDKAFITDPVFQFEEPFLLPIEPGKEKDCVESGLVPAAEGTEYAQIPSSSSSPNLKPITHPPVHNPNTIIPPPTPAATPKIPNNPPSPKPSHPQNPNPHYLQKISQITDAWISSLSPTPSPPTSYKSSPFYRCVNDKPSRHETTFEVSEGSRILSSYWNKENVRLDGPCIKIIENTVQSTSEPSRPAYGIRPPPVSIPPNVKEFLDVHRPTNSEQIRMLAEKVHKPSNTILLVAAGWSHLHYLLNFLYKKREVSSTGLDHIAIVCLDRGMQRLLEFLNFECYYEEEEEEEEVRGVGGGTARWPVTIQLLSLGIHVLVVDTDAPFVKDPFSNPPIGLVKNLGESYIEVVDIIGQQSGMPDVTEKVFGAALCVGWLWLRGGDVRVIEHAALLQMMHVYTEDKPNRITGDQWPWNVIMLEQDIQFVNYENAHEIGPFVGIATRGGEGDSSPPGSIVDFQNDRLNNPTTLGLNPSSPTTLTPYSKFFSRPEGSLLPPSSSHGLRTMNLNSRIISRSTCEGRNEDVAKKPFLLSLHCLGRNGEKAKLFYMQEMWNVRDSLTGDLELGLMAALPTNRKSRPGALKYFTTTFNEKQIKKREEKVWWDEIEGGVKLKTEWFEMYVPDGVEEGGRMNWFLDLMKEEDKGEEEGVEVGGFYLLKTKG
ncbi:hypothetical protein TL16_g03319 [Triparma laevis f. inornata]|uniref:Nucleotide-diphospho-sugar transferase domain-containing protein n=1 Tax=Triparma laevis f. inornata TaxID=1714386 RepID=A0A9W6ZXQ1_9STRA|nr:hypothetical protein TL16_g03319 [Triparma laevis f. inornata]